MWYMVPWAHLSEDGIWIGSAVLHRRPQGVPILYNGTPLSHLKITPSHGGSGPHLIHGSLGPSESSTQRASRSVQPFLQGWLLWQTDRPRYSVGNNRPHLRMSYGWCGLIVLILLVTVFMMLSSWRGHCKSSPGSFDECRWPPTLKPSQLTRPVSLPVDCYHPHSPSPFISITHYYAFIVLVVAVSVVLCVLVFYYCGCGYLCVCWLHVESRYILLSPKADTHFAVPWRVEGWVDLCSAVRVRSPCTLQWLSW